MKLVAENIGVDAGLIMVADIAYAKDVKKFGFCMKELKRLGKIFEVPNGRYKVEYRIPYMREDDDGNLMEDEDICSGHEELTVTGGKVFIVDPCYPIGKDAKGNHVGDKWGEWLTDTDFANELHSEKAFTISSMCGDGGYEVHLTLEKV